jgi:prepilin-type N-terminal cleavage/methylation domain-containing protein
MRNLTKERKAFTMLELVFVIVVLGILAALALPRMDRDLRQEAADNILSAIRYTQHLALNDDKTDPFDSNWQQKLWMIRFTTSTSNTGSFYTISSDLDKSGSVNKTEAAIDPINGKYMYNSSGAFVGIASDESPNIFIGKKYGIDSLTPSGGCSSQHIAFDNLGRPFSGLKTTTGGTLAANDYATYMSSDCNLTFGFVDSLSPLIITIEKETGYAYIVRQEDS